MAESDHLDGSGLEDQWSLFQKLLAGLVLCWIVSLPIAIHALAWMFPEDVLMKGTIGPNGSGLRPSILGYIFFVLLIPSIIGFLAFRLFIWFLDARFAFRTWGNRTAVCYLLMAWFAMATIGYIVFATYHLSGMAGIY
jgi:hypothetical protein